MFEHIQAAPPDAILGLSEAFNKDPNPKKVNLSVGVFKDESGKTPIPDSVKEAERRLLDKEKSKSYLPIDGLAEFCQLTEQQLFGSQHEVVTSKRASTAQTPGGTGALRVAADFIHTHFPNATVWCSAPTWPNHPKIFLSAGLKTKEYAYFDPATHGINFSGMLAAINQMPAGDVICLHACCHNPTGADPTAEQWKQIADAVYARGVLPLLDFAYLGFGDGLQQDATALRELARPGVEMLVASSYSKNFGLYNERVGALTVVTKSAEAAGKVASQVKAAIRTNYSNPPSHGGAIVREILADPALRSQWEAELAGMRNRINGMRKLFTETMAKKLPARDFRFIEKQRGMFSYTGLTAQQVDLLKEKFGVYAVRDGRINIAGITTSNCEPLCDAIAAVIQETGS